MAKGLDSSIWQTIWYWLLRRLPTCEALAPVMSVSLERPLTLRERIRLRVHLLTCNGCVWYLEQLHYLRRKLGSRGESDDRELSTEARERIRRALDDARR